MQYLLLARHGNTFATGQKVVWVGARNDLLLVESGIAQAHIVAQALKESSIAPQAIYAASLKRTATYAQIIHEQLNLPEVVKIDSRLNEIDYGSWSGLSNDEIKARYGTDELDEWNKYGRWPKSFAGSEVGIEKEISSFVQDVIISQPNKKIVLTITSNGCLKYFLKLTPDAYAKYIQESKWKVGTGQLCILGYENKTWQVVSWNENPQSAFLLLKSKTKTLADSN